MKNNRVKQETKTKTEPQWRVTEERYNSFFKIKEPHQSCSKKIARRGNGCKQEHSMPFHTRNTVHAGGRMKPREYIWEKQKKPASTGAFYVFSTRFRYCPLSSSQCPLRLMNLNVLVFFCFLQYPPSLSSAAPFSLPQFLQAERNACCVVVVCVRVWIGSSPEDVKGKKKNRRVLCCLSLLVSR